MRARVAVLVLALAAAACGSGEGRDEVPSSLGDGTASTYVAGSCTHDPCATGRRLTSSCDACVSQICKQDSYCCRTKWDQQCVNEVGSICGESCGGGGGAPDMSVAPDMSTGGGGGGGGGGGTKLKLAVFGDCRPPNQNDTSGYPSTVVSGIFELAQAHGAQLVIGTGDYMFAGTSTAVNAQVQLFLQARASYSGPVYLAMGNHECNGYTSSNCPNLDETPNVQAFMSKLAPSGVTKPYFRVDVPAAHGTAKILFVAANAWDTAQQTWLKQQLAQPTTYTFVVRHEPASASTAPGVSPSESLIKQASYTLELNGHTHEYKRVDTSHVISGNAGAPLQSGASYGLLILEEQDNGNITVTELDEATGQATDTWTVTPTGKGA